MTTENDGILNGAPELTEGLNRQGSGGAEELLLADTLLPPSEPEGSDPPAVEAVSAPPPADDSQGDGPPLAEDGGAPGAGEVPASGEAPAEDADGTGLAPGESEEGEGLVNLPSEEKPKRKRAAPRKKAAPKTEEAPPPPDEAPTGDSEPEERGREDVEDDGLGPVEEEVVSLPAGGVPAVAAPRSVPGKPGAPVVRRRALAGLDLREMDRYLSEEQQREWNEIYASYRSKTVLSGHIMGVDRDEFKVKNRETGIEELQRMHTVIVIPYRVKVLIPESEMWMPGEERPGHVLRNMVGAKIEFSVLDLDREGECAIGSRRMAMAARRHLFGAMKGGHKEGELLTCNVLAVGPKRCLVDCNGYDLSLTQRDLTYTAVADLRERYHPGQELPCVLKEFSHKEDKLSVSVKEVNPNPFDGADQRHPINSRRQAVISGKYGGGVFCTLPDDTTCLCLYSAQHNDSDFHEGDTVIVAIKQYDYKRQLIYGRILARW